MRRLALLLLAAPLLMAPSYPEKVLTVMVIDTGVDGKIPALRKYIPDHIKDSKHAKDAHGHGTHVFGVIAAKACPQVKLIPCRAFPPEALDKNNKSRANLLHACFRMAVKLKVDIVNFSGGRESYDSEEHALVKQMNANKTILVTAAGNEANSMKEIPYYPAAYQESNVVAVGSLNARKPARTSNYGKKGMVWEQGTNIYSFAPGGKKVYMSGTSMATAQHTAKLVEFFCKMK